MEASSNGWITHPEEEGRQVYMKSFLEKMLEFGVEAGQPLRAGALQTVRQVLRHLNKTVHDPQTDFRQLANLYADLHRLEDMFESMQERQPN